MIKAKTKWIKRIIDEKHVTSIQQKTGVSKLVAQYLGSRDFSSIDEIDEYLYPKMSHIHDPFLFSHMEQAVERITEAIEKDEKILIYGDYDADGVTSTAILIRTLREMNGNVDYYIPNRFSEGYGPNKEAFLKAKENGFQLIITVDNGISGIDEMTYAKELGMDVIITDHHEMKDVLPEAVAVLHPKLPGDEYPYHELSGAGVALKLSQALLGKIRDDLLELATVGTIGDLVPLTGENRAIVRFGLKRMIMTTNQGIKALLQQNQVEPHAIDEDTIGFIIGPRINAVGRLVDARLAVELLITDDENEAKVIAKELDAYNRERQKIVSEITDEALEMAELQMGSDENKVLVVASEGWNPGVVGIVASKLVNHYYRPAIVLCINPETGFAKGSARSIAGFDLFKELSNVSDLMDHFGGHPMAAGLTLKIDQINILRSKLNHRGTEILQDEMLVPTTKIDVDVKVEDINIQSLRELKNLSPFGSANPKPVFCIEGAKVLQARTMGSEANHLKVTIGERRSPLECVGFHSGHLYENIQMNADVSVVGSLGINEWNGSVKPQMMLQDLKTHKEIPIRLYGDNDIFEQVKVTKEPRIWFVNSDAEREEIEKHFPNDKVSYYHEELLNTGEIPTVIIYGYPLDQPAGLSQKGLTSIEQILVLSKESTNQPLNDMVNRDNFIKIYQFLKLEKTLQIDEIQDKIGISLGLTVAQTKFIVKVFFELDFVTIDNGCIFVVENPPKRDLTESKSYKKASEQAELQRKFARFSKDQWKEWLI